MNKQEFVAKIMDKTGTNKASAQRFVNAFIDTITETLVEGDKVQLVGFGTFETRERNGRNATNPQTGARLWIESRVVPAFKPGKAFKDAVNK